MDERRSARLAAGLRSVLLAQRLHELLDTEPPGGGPPAPLHQRPNVDLAVIDLTGDGRPRAAANVLLSPHYPDGVIVPLDAGLGTHAVRWRRWSDQEWDACAGQGSADALPGRERAPIDFMSPYPASVLKLLVGFGVLRLVDTGAVTLDEVYPYDPTGAPSPDCGGPTNRTVRELFDDMITTSSNPSSCALVHLLHRRNGIDPLNALFVRLGMPMLQLVGTRAIDGGRWADTQMNALDTAKLLLIINGSPGTLWLAPDGVPVTAEVLSPESRRLYLGKLHEQGLNQTLSTPNWYGRSYPAQGLPQRISERWIDPITGTVTVHHRVYNQDVRPSLGAAEVTFAHKPGLVDTSANDAGIVKSLPGRPERHYIVALHTNLGDRYVDAHRPPDPPDTFPVPLSEKFAHLGKAIDTFMVAAR